VKRVSWLAVIGGALVISGVAWWSVPAAAIVAGVALLAASWEANS
jgi:hypothetical protein